MQDAAKGIVYNLEHRDTRQRARYKFHSPPLLHSSASLASLALSAAWFFFSCLQMSALMLKTTDQRDGEQGSQANGWYIFGLLLLVSRLAKI